MLHCIYKRRKGLAKTAGFVGGVYLLQRYVTDRLDELKAKLDQEKLAREALKRRFQTAQEDVSYTVLALLPTLAEQIMEGMDVEALTQELQARSKARDAAPNLQQMIRQRYIEGHHPVVRAQAANHEREETQPSLGSSIVNVDPVRDLEVRSEAGSTASTRDGESSSSWVEASAAGRSPQPSSPKDDSPYQIPNEPQLSDSVLTMNTATTEGSVGNESRLSDSVTSLSAASDSTQARTKVELWAEVKMLTFTRTLTTLYSITLLCLLTTIQLTVLARSKYVNSVLDAEREEMFREQLESQLSLPNLLLSQSTRMIQDLLSVDLSILDDDEVEMGDLEGDGITQEVERKFLTLSWWILHVGWKDVGERVRRGVEEVFEGVSLKTKLAAIDVHRLVRDVRRRVEHEVTFEGRGRRINFLSTLLPPTPEMIQHVLTQGGFLPDSSPEPPASQNDQASQTQDTTTMSFSELSHDFDASPAAGLSGMFNNPHNPHNVGPVPSHTPLVNPVCAHNHTHHPNGADQDVDACIDCASVSHLQPDVPPDAHPQAQTHLHSSLKHVQDPPFMALVDETRAIITSPDFEYVLEACLDCATAVLFEGLEKSVFVAGEGVPADEEVRIRLAGLLPGLAKWSRLTLRGLPNELIDSLLVLREVTSLSAVVFSKFEEKVKAL